MGFERSVWVEEVVWWVRERGMLWEGEGDGGGRWWTGEGIGKIT